MRARLLEITTSLTEFGKIRETQADLPRLDPVARENFEKEANLLLEAARGFERMAGRATSLALGGTSFAAAAIQMCGIPPTTYNAPVLKYSKGAAA